MRELNSIRKELFKLKDKQEDASIRYLMKDGSIVTLTRKDARNEIYMAWVENNAHPEYRDSTGSKCHLLTQMVNNTVEAPFESWESFKARGHDLLFDEFLTVEAGDGVA